ncbi:GRIP and coiled-coil domain-containing protein 2 [Ictalurus furcatus]|uniref:GRIP and coiled-coil domain-containing protein 2 n=1 Tax=Ictalurus furcatus TaxID=66913 RepID=UPI002350EC93|nr:GRIP and coiled-coil domain-containing protein 2 [Ictalurus furcatus]
MEKEPDVECGSSSCMGNGKSKLDTLSKDDLIKFAKKQMGAMQKLKSKCADLEEKVGALKALQGAPSNDSVIQELTERMDAVLLEKAETQQMLVLMRKENETLRNQREDSMEKMAALQQKLDHVEKNHAEKIKLMEVQFETSETKYKEELEFLKKITRENEEIQRHKLQEDFNSKMETINQEYERKISDLEQNLELAKKEWITEKETLKETHQISLQKTQEEIDHFQEMISRLNRQYEDEVSYLEEQLEINAAQFDMERERLLLVQEELSEQIALKESYLQDVQEEEEDLNRRTQKPSELIKALDSSVVEDPENEMDKLRLEFADLQSQNTMLKEELTFLTNVKTALEGDLKHLKKEFRMEREELEFKINELQMTKEEAEVCPEKEVNFMNVVETIRLEEHNQILKELKELHNAEMKELEAHLISNKEREKEVIVQEAQDLQNTFKVLSEEKQAIASEYEHTKEILRNIEMELGDRTFEFVKKYNTMKEQAANSVQELEEKLREKDSIIEKLKCFEQTQDNSEQKLQHKEDIVPEDKEVHKFMMSDKENMVTLKEILIYIDKIRFECKDGGMDTAQITLQKLEDLAMTLEVALDEKKSLRNCIDKLESQLSFSGHEKDQEVKNCNTSVEDLAVSNKEMAELQKDHQSALQERDALRKDLETSEEKLFEAQKQICYILAQNYSAKIDEEEDISVLLNHLLSRVEEDKTTCIASNEEKAKLQKDLQAVSDERNELKKIIETSERKLSDTQRHVCEILEQHYSVKIDSEEDISVLLNQLLSSIHEEKKSYIMLNEEKMKQQRDLVIVVEEREDLKRCMETRERNLSDARRNICQMLEQNYSVKIDSEEDISVLLNQLLSSIQEEKKSCIMLNEEKMKQQRDLVIVVEEREDLKRCMETLERNLSDARRNICQMLEQNYSVKIDSEEDISVLLNQLLSSIQEEKKSCIMLNEEKMKQQRDLVIVVEEREDLKRCMETLERNLSDARRNVCEILEQNYSENTNEEEDIPVLLKHLQSRVQEEKLILTQQLDEKTVQLSQLNQQAELSDDGNLQVQSDTENLQRDQNEQVEITGRLVGQEHEEPAVEGGAQETDDMKRLQQKLSEKESIVAHLKEEISLLQESKLSAFNENMRQMESLEKENKEKEERLNKFKAVAVKARKELDNSKKEASRLKEELEALKSERDKMSDSMKAIIHGAEAYKNLMIDYDKQTELLDQEKDKLEASEKLVGDLTKRLHVAVEQHKQLSTEREDLMAHMETLQSNVRQLEAQALEMHKLKSSVERDLEAERLLKEQKTKEHACAVKEVEELHTVLQKQKQQLQQTEHELEQLRKDAQQSTLLDMEMADYERLVRELNLQISDKDRLLEEQERQTQAQREREEKLNQEIESLKSLVDIGEEKTAKVKQLLVKAKKDLADAKKEEASQKILQSSLKGELEAIQQQLESYKIQCSELTVDRHRLQEQLKSVSDQHQKSVTAYQHQVTTLQNDLSSSKAEFESTKSDFDSYKVRVHNVLKQQKTKSSTESNGDFSKQDRENMESMLEQLRSKLQESQLNAQSCNAELQQLQTEYDTLLERHNKMLQQTITKEAELRERLLSLHSENVALKSEHSQSVMQLTAQTETLRSSFREQLHHLQDEHRSTVETLQHQINRLETQLFQLQKEPATSAAQQQSKKPQSDKKLADLPLLELNMAREEGEGMETTETESVSTAGTPPPSLEQLLTSPDPKHEPFVWQVEPTKEELTNKLNTATRSMEHMNSLLHESEATNAILMEQINLLKSEMRRLERNQEREKSVANLEYLKNVLLQFIFLHAGSEKQALLPVIHTMLQLSPEEKNKLSAIAHGEEEAAASRGSGWTSYLHSWSGIR